MEANVPPTDPPSHVDGDDHREPQEPSPRRETPPQLNMLELCWPWIVRFTGLGIAIWETIVENADRPSLLLLAAAMVGLPEFVKWDRARRNGNGNGARK